MKIIPALAAALVLFAAAAAGTDILAGLGLTRASAGAGILEALVSGTPYNEVAMKAFKALPPASRAATVSAGLGWIKAYAGSGEFAAAYAAWRQKEQPAPPAPRPAADEQAKKMKADMEKSIAEMRKGMAAMDAETKKVLEASIRGMREQMERLESDPQQKALWRQMADMASLEDKKRHEEELKAWEGKWPADLRVLIRRRIHDFLVVSAGVDFSATLVPRGEQMAFASSDYESKPPEWKLCFRAGKEATAAARAFAAAWLAELDKAGIPGR